MQIRPIFFAAFRIIPVTHAKCRAYSTFARKFLSLSLLGEPKISSGVPCSTITPSSINMTRSETSLAKPIS